MGAFEAILLIVFLGTRGDVPQGGLEGPFVLPGFHTMEDCEQTRAVTEPKWIAREAAEHRVAPEAIRILSICRASGMGA